MTFIQIYALCMRMEFTASWHFNFCNTVSEYLHAAININWMSFTWKTLSWEKEGAGLSDINTKVSFRWRLFREWYSWKRVTWSLITNLKLKFLHFPCKMKCNHLRNLLSNSHHHRDVTEIFPNESFQHAKLIRRRNLIFAKFLLQVMHNYQH